MNWISIKKNTIISACAEKNIRSSDGNHPTQVCIWPLLKFPNLDGFRLPLVATGGSETGTATFQSHSHFHLHALILDSQKSPLACVIFIMLFFFITCHTKIPPASDTTTSRSSKFASIPLSGSLEDGC